MMKKPNFSAKKMAIDKANASLVIAIGIAAFISVFSIVAAKSLISQGRYQARVISKKEVALKQLKSNTDSVAKLNTAYQEFSSTPENILGGNPNGAGDRDGDNPRIILDALPSEYDFPALATSIEKMLKDNNFVITNLTGTDDEVAQADKSSEPNPQPIEIPFTVDVSTSSGSAKTLMGLFERSIRPIQVKKIAISGQNDQLKVSITATTFFQPGKNLDVREETVK